MNALDTYRQGTEADTFNAGDKVVFLTGTSKNGTLAAHQGTYVRCSIAYTRDGAFRTHVVVDSETGREVKTHRVRANTSAPVVKGSRVSMAVGGTGTVTDVDRGFGEALVRHDSGSVEDMTYGQWHSLASLTPFGYDGNAMVWRGQGVAPAGPQH